ncbi:MAG: hypothetical protein HUJ98_07340 [Bacteroidaceae bacterium]|nr:hypothetical protein [Bacteroidaceae bacterium]
MTYEIANSIKYSELVETPVVRPCNGKFKSYVVAGVGEILFLVVVDVGSTGNNYLVSEASVRTEQIPTVVNRCPEALSKQLSADSHKKISFQNRIEELSHLGDNWDCRGAVPMEETTLNNVKSVAEMLTGGMLDYWDLFPDVNGTVLLTTKDGQIASISIGNEEFSYAAVINNQRMIGQEKFDSHRVVSTIKHMHQFLGYETNC